MFPGRALPASWTLHLGMFLFLRRRQKRTPKIHHYPFLHMKCSLLLLIKLCGPLGRCYNLNFCAQLLTWCLSMLLLFAVNNIFLLLLQLCNFVFPPKVLCHMFEISRCLVFALTSGNPKDEAAGTHQSSAALSIIWINCVAH